MAKGAGKTLTKERLIQSALELFASRWYETVSIAEICRNAGLSNGVFYNYFTKKEEIFKELLDRYLAIFSDRLNQVVEPTVAGELHRFLTVMFETREEYRKLFTVYREGQYRFVRYERKLREILLSYFGRVYGRELDEAEYIYLVSAVRFLVMRSVDDHVPVDERSIHALLMEGVFTEEVRDQHRIFVAPQVPVEDSDDSSRNGLLEAGMKLFGKRGYYTVSVYDVAKEAGLSVGAFYLYFTTKEEFLSEIVSAIGARTRHYISSNLDPTLNRTEQEVQGMFLFHSYFSEHKSYYSIVLEAEFVVSDEVTRYYDKFERGYGRTLDHVKLGDTRLVANALMGISHYLGIESIFTKNVTDIRATLVKMGALLSSGLPR